MANQNDTPATPANDAAWIAAGWYHRAWPSNPQGIPPKVAERRLSIATQDAAAATGPILPLRPPTTAANATRWRPP